MASPGAWQFTSTSKSQLTDGTFQIGTTTFKMGLFLSTSNLGSGSTTYAGLTNEVANANGYTTGGVSITVTKSGTTTITITSGNAVWTASGGQLLARYAVIYAVGGNVLCYCLLDSSPADVRSTNGNTFTVTIGTGIIQY